MPSFLKFDLSDPFMFRRSSIGNHAQLRRTALCDLRNSDGSNSLAPLSLRKSRNSPKCCHVLFPVLRVRIHVGPDGLCRSVAGVQEMIAFDQETGCFCPAALS
jgi:hypothetical protein